MLCYEIVTTTGTSNSNSPNDDSLHITAGRKKEGVAILWNKNLINLLSPINTSMIGLLVSRYYLIIRKCIYLMFIFLMTNLIKRKNILIV